MADFSVRYGDTLKVHNGQLSSGVDEATKLPKKYTPPSGSTLRLVVRLIQGPGARINLTTDLATDGKWSRAWTTADFTALSGSPPAALLAFEGYLEVTDSNGKKITFPDDTSYTLNVMPAF